MMSNLKFIGLMALISCICLANGRQIRYSRYTTEISEGDVDEGNIVEPFEVEATVREIKFAPYPAAGYRPPIAFPLPNEQGGADLSDSGSEVVTDEPESLALTTTTETTSIADEATEMNNVKAPYPAAGFRPKVPFNLPERNLAQSQRAEITTEATSLSESTTGAMEADPTTTTTYMPEFSTAVPLAEFTTRATEEPLTDVTTKPTEEPSTDFTTEQTTEVEIKAPYPAAGFKPKIPFNLPTRDQVQFQETESETTEIPNDAEVEEEVVKAPYPPAGFRPSKAFLLPNEQLNEDESKDDNSKHPACGSSTNPLAPKPIDGEKKDPDAETIFVNPQTVVVPVRFTTQPLLVARPLLYTTHIQTW